MHSTNSFYCHKQTKFPKVTSKLQLYEDTGSQTGCASFNPIFNLMKMNVNVFFFCYETADMEITTRFIRPVKVFLDVSS